MVGMKVYAIWKVDSLMFTGESFNGFTWLGMGEGKDIRILHVDGDSFFASCEIALNPALEGRPVWVGGGRHGDGIVIAANREAKKYGVQTGMPCYEAKRLCPHGVLCKPHYEEYRQISERIFRILEEYSPVLVPLSIDEGFLDLTGMDAYVWKGSGPLPYVRQIVERIWVEVKIPVSAGIGSSPLLAKLATDVAKPGILEVPSGQEKEFLEDKPVEGLSGVGEQRKKALNALGVHTFGDVAKLPSVVLRQRFGIWGQQLWLFANGLWKEPLQLEVSDRTVISSNTTLPYDEPDYEAALMFTLAETVRLVGQLRREGLQAREVGLAIRFNDFTEAAGKFRFKHPQFRNSVINAVVEGIFRDLVSKQVKPIRQIRLALWNLSRLDTQPTLWGGTYEERWGALDQAIEKLVQQLGKQVVTTGTQLAWEQRSLGMKNPKPKCPFVPVRELVVKLWGTSDSTEGEAPWISVLQKVSKHHKAKTL